MATNVPSSISSSKQRLPQLAWAAVLLPAVLLLAVGVTAMEFGLAKRGYMPSLADSYWLWQIQRRRADALGTRALILVGNSRMQNDLDLDTLHRDTGLEPVQLAIGGTSFVPVLRSLAEDPGITGTVVVNFEADALALPARHDLAYDYSTDYQRHGQTPDFFQAEDWLSDQLHFGLRSYADGTRPLTALLLRILPDEASRQFQTLGPDRQVRIDFSRTNNSQRYALVRAVRELGPPFAYDPEMSDAELRTALQVAIARLQAADDTRFREGARQTADMAAAIESRGGHVLFVVLPRAGLVREIDDRRYPRDRFWQPFAASSPGAVDYEDVPGLQAFTYPDDSHLDERDQARFSAALLTALHLGKVPAQ